MTKKKIDEVKKWADEFMHSVYEMEKEIDAGRPLWVRSKQSATLRRRSMDLTNALADLRKPE